MNKEKEIEEVDEFLQSKYTVSELSKIVTRSIAETFVEAGYCKASEVRKEVLTEILEFIQKRGDALNNLFGANIEPFMDLADEIEARFGGQDDTEEVL